jgi:feruloyl-CoA synthase
MGELGMKPEKHHHEVAPAQHELGLKFDGRIAEDFKLATGTFVSVGPLRAKIIAAGAPYIQDVVITGLNTKASGDLLTVQFNGLRMSADWGGPAAAAQIIVRQLHIVLVAEMIIEIRQTGTTVLD